MSGRYRAGEARECAGYRSRVDQFGLSEVCDPDPAFGDARWWDSGRTIWDTSDALEVPYTSGVAQPTWSAEMRVHVGRACGPSCWAFRWRNGTGGGGRCW